MHRVLHLLGRVPRHPRPPGEPSSVRGARTFVQLAAVAMHPVDNNNSRMSTVADEFGLEYCNITKCCTDVCPEGIHITDNAIIPLDERRVDELYDPLRITAHKLFNRS